MTELARPQFEETWTSGREFTPEEAWLDLIHLADSAGVLPVVSFTDRWLWKNAEVADFFTALGKHGHLRPHDPTHWRLTYQAQDRGLVDDYEDVWKIYPKRVAKQKGYHAYAATRKGRDGGPPIPARTLYDATLRYSIARKDEDMEFILHPGTFFGPDERWKEKHKPKTNSKTKGTKGWSRPTSRDLTKIPGGQTKGPSPNPKKSPPKKRTTPKNPRKKTPKKEDPLGDL